jgi:hypothetical protein
MEEDATLFYHCMMAAILFNTMVVEAILFYHMKVESIPIVYHAEAAILVLIT